MQYTDTPIKLESEDILGRLDFVQHLSDSICSWNNKEESLVIALCGEWGSGKSSVINLLKLKVGDVNKKQSSNIFNKIFRILDSFYLSVKNYITNPDPAFSAQKVDYKPTIIDFNPWYFSGDGKLNMHFFDELSKELKMKNRSKVDKKIAKKLKLYSNALGLANDAAITDIITKMAIPFIGILFTIDYLNKYTYLILPLSAILVVIGTTNIVIKPITNFLKNLSTVFETRGEIREKSTLEFKEDLRKNLMERNNNLLVIIDDIDRLTKSEIKQIFQLVKINTDLPNIIYLLSYDKKIVEKNLNEQDGFSGNDYLKKIVQVDFDIPAAPTRKVEKHLDNEIKRLLSNMPASHEEYWDDYRWYKIYHSGIKHFFKNLRDVKRYINSLEFNLNYTQRKNSIEVNPIDFIALEVIRVWLPDYYNYIRSRKDIFSKVSSLDKRDKETRTAEYNESLSKVKEEHCDNLEHILINLFPQLSENEKANECFKNLRICHEKHFDTYFTFIPGGNEEELSQSDIDLVFKDIGDFEKLAGTFKTYTMINKMQGIIPWLIIHADNENKIPFEDINTLVKAIFNIPDDISINGKHPLEEEIENISRLISQLLWRYSDMNAAFDCLKESIEESNSLTIPIYYVEHLDRDGNNNVGSSEDLQELKRICVNKIKQNKSNNNLFENYYIDGILLAWKRWDDSRELNEYIESFIENDEFLINFVKKFVRRIYGHSREGHYVRETYSETPLSNLIDLEIVKTKFETIKSRDEMLYKSNKEDIELYLTTYNQKITAFPKIEK